MTIKLLGQRDKLITIVVFTALAAIFAFAFYLPNRKARLQLLAEMQTIETSIREIPLRLAEIDALEKDVVRHREYLQRLQKRVPLEADVHRMIEQVTALARRTNLQVSRIEPLSPTPHQTYQQLSFRMSFAGAYGNILKFFSGLEKQERMFTVEEFTTGRRQGNSGKTIECDTVFSIYVMHAEKSDFSENNDKSGPALADTQIR